MTKHSFDPIIPSYPSILILGSLPGDLSLLENQYYAHPQNRFWKILFSLYNLEFSTDYLQRINLLNKNQIALWDVCASAVRPGSMDTDIVDVNPNPINNLLASCPSIHTVFFNGQKAHKLYEKHFNKLSDINYVTLPSTSPANARFTMNLLLEHWHIIK